MSPSAAIFFVAGLTTTAFVLRKASPSGDRNSVPFGSLTGLPSGDSFLTVITPAAWRTFALSFS